MRRAPLADVLSSNAESVIVRESAAPSTGVVPVLSASCSGPYRPRTKVVAPPPGEHALDRVLSLTKSSTNRAPARVVEVPPGEAADLILEAIRQWGDGQS